MAYSCGLAIDRLFEELEESNIVRDNKETVKKFLREQEVSGLKEGTLRWKLYTCIRLSKMFPEKKFEDLTKDDIVSFLHDVKPRSKSNYRDKARIEFSDSTKVLFKIHTKNFFKWLNGGKEYPPCVDWIYAAGDTSKKMDEKDILTPQEVLALVRAAGSTRDAAFIATLFETGCRISEWLDINYSDISLEGQTATIRVSGKTGQRTVYLIKSLTYFRDWLNAHPFKDKDNFPIWISMESTTFGHRILPGTVRKNMLRIKKIAGIKKPINPHAFRHARATDCARRGYQEALMRKMFGWSKNSDMPSTYIHLVSKDVKDKLMSEAGLEQNYCEKNTALDLITCPKCNKQYSAGTKFCTCGFVLDDREALTIGAEKSDTALHMMQNLVKDMKELESKGADFKQFGEFMKQWATKNQK